MTELSFLMALGNLWMASFLWGHCAAAYIKGGTSQPFRYHSTPILLGIGSYIWVMFS